MGNSVMEKIKGGLVVSCQALEDEPLHSAFIMSKMALAAVQGGAVGIRANTAKIFGQFKVRLTFRLSVFTKKITMIRTYLSPPL